MTLQITRCKQHFIDWDAVGGIDKFIADYKNAPTYADRRAIIDSLPLQTNLVWLAARRKHITASKMKDFLGMDRSGKNPGAGYKNVVKKLVAEELGWEEPELTWNEKASVKRGLAFESRAVELFEKETGIKLKTDIGFGSTEIDGLPFGGSTDAYAGDADTQKFDCIGEIKSFELMRLLDEIETLHSTDTMEQMQGLMKIFNCPRCYKILYCAELDRIFYLKYTRGLDFANRLAERIPIAKEYRQELLDNLQYTDLTDKIMAE